MIVRRKSKAKSLSLTCPVAYCMKFLGGAGTANVIWHLKEAPRRFTELKDDVPGISAKVLSARLKMLEEEGLVYRQVVKSSPPSVEYVLSPLGKKLIPALEAICEVGQRLRKTDQQVLTQTPKNSTAHLTQI